MNLKVKLIYKKSTKGTHVYGNDEPEAPIPSVYIKRSAFSGDLPQVITMQIEDYKDGTD